MTSRLKKAADVLRRAEAELQALIADAAASKDYREVRLLADIAQRFSGSIQGGDTSAGPPAEELAERTPVRRPRKTNRKKRARRSRPKSSADYPRFERQQDVLIKVGWSSAKRAEYEHRTPFAAVQAVARRLAETGDVQSPLTADDIQDVTLAGGQQIPSYQTYLCLAWLRHLGLLQQEGRKGFSVRESSSLDSDVVDSWKQMAQRGGD